MCYKSIGGDCMKIMEKFRQKMCDPFGKEAVTIAFLGDSVTQGCFEVYTTEDAGLETVYDTENAYHTHLRKLLNHLYPKVPVNIINAGISGGTAGDGAARLQRDVLRFSPDLCVVCFGLNDSCNPAEDAPEAYRAALADIFTRLRQQSIEVIFMTPNMMCTAVSPSIEDETIRGTAASVVQVQNSGRLEQFLTMGKETAAALDIPVCDCYAKWQRLASFGVDTNALLANGINHPTRDMNWLFAMSLADTMMK